MDSRGDDCGPRDPLLSRDSEPFLDLLGGLTSAPGMDGCGNGNGEEPFIAQLCRYGGIEDGVCADDVDGDDDCLCDEEDEDADVEADVEAAADLEDLPRL